MKKILFVVLVISLFSCSNDNVIEDKQASEELTEEIILLKDFIAKTMSVDVKHIFYDVIDSRFIIEEDMMISLDQVRQQYNKKLLKITNKTTQNYYNKIWPEYRFVTIFISFEVSSEWKIAINNAINNWNTTNTGITLHIVNSAAEAQTKITAALKGNVSAIASAGLPGGKAGQYIEINTYYNNLDADSKTSVMTHEIGHILGLLHSDTTSGTYVPCTPLSDNSSIMFPLHDVWRTGITVYDNVAISVMYPLLEGTTKLYRYKKNQYYFYTTDPCEIISDKNEYIFDGDAGYLHSTPISGTVPLYRSLNGTIVKDHKLSTIQKSAEDVVLGYVYVTKEPKTTALYSNISSYDYFPTVNHYMYTTVTNEDVVKKIIVGYVLTK
ncbi:Dual-action HEIGH metallo-peptidase [Flavobacterium aquidurense]|uniref:Peptidase metallopeptidase domain-containing protein n=1 Tax=Flavobacterium frigidimaris TaxID=262320 RepID=A0ABX4BQV6_FLAFR|nr:M57 family metalloprotease [Flavobacterium frigidimaris]OXA79548.1 hypothetical protein B0A65_09245 [Flavobacterium frigidimaris]SDZ21296.1 Dual-action HEIGH metallo-peptidase [Flavobacterium aquidurense]